MYPTIILLLVENNRSLNTTYFSSSSIIDVRGVYRLQRVQLESLMGYVSELS